MSGRRKACVPLGRAALIKYLRELGYNVATQQDALTALSGVVVTQTLEIDDLQATVAAQNLALNDLAKRLVAIETRQPAQFIRG